MNDEMYAFEVSPPCFSVIGLGEVGCQAVSALLARGLDEYKPTVDFGNVRLNFSVIVPPPITGVEADLVILIADPEDTAVAGLLQEEQPATLLLVISPTQSMAELQAWLHGGDLPHWVDCALAVGGTDTPVDETHERLVHLLAGMVGLLSQNLIALDFADLRTVLTAGGASMFGSAWASGPDRAVRAAETALASRWPANGRIDQAGGVWVAIHAPESLAMEEFYEVLDFFQARVAESTVVIVGAPERPDPDDGLRVTFMAIGIGNSQPT